MQNGERKEADKQVKSAKIAAYCDKKKKKTKDKTIRNRGRLLSSSLSVFSVGRQI